MDLISIIIPIYNRRNIFKSALASVYKQNYRPLELIVVDDGSTEDIASLVSEFKMQHPDINTIYHKQENQGAPAARNKGFELSSGDYVIFWDADVLGYEYMLEKMYKVLQENNQASFAYSNFIHGSKMMYGREFDVQALQKNNYIHSTSLIRKKDAIKWDESLKRFQDWDLWLTMIEQNKKGVWIKMDLFVVTPGGTMSAWLPKLAYTPPFKYLPFISPIVKKYEEAREVIRKKHDL